MKDLLDRCPFCGGEAKVFAYNDGGICVKCLDCFCQTTVRTDLCIADVKGVGKSSAFEKCVSDWNNRPDPVEPEEYEGTWYCGKCHDPINKGDKFCHECGREVMWE